MTAIMPKDEAQKLLDCLGSSDEAWTYDPDDSKIRDQTGYEIAWDANPSDGAMVAAAPALARSLIAAHDEMERLRAEHAASLIRINDEAVAAVAQERADAQAAVALVVERASEVASRHWEGEPEDTIAMEAEIRALATPDGIALVAELRAERDGAIAAEKQRDAELQEQHRVRKAWADRAIAAEADNARLAAQVEALTGALERVGSGEGMTGTFAIRQNTQEGSELMARMKYARAALEAATLAAMTPAEQADFDLTMRIRGAAGDIAKAQISAREDGE